MIRFLSRKEMAAGRGISLSSEKRLERRYPKKYPLMVELGPGRKGATEADNDDFNKFLIEQSKRKAMLRDREKLPAQDSASVAER